MRTILFITLISLSFTLAAQDEKLPEAVKAAFDAKYTKISGLEWKTDDGYLYILEYYRSGTMYTSIFDKNGTWKETSEVVADTDIPLNMQQYLHATYPSALISYAEKVETDDNQHFFRIYLIENDQESMVKSDLKGVVINN